MKRLSMVVFLIICLLLSSCSSNNSNNHAASETGSAKAQQQETEQTKSSQTEAITGTTPTPSIRSYTSSEDSIEKPPSVSSIAGNSEKNSGKSDKPGSTSVSGHTTEKSSINEAPAENIPSVSYATAEDAKEIAMCMIDRINNYRIKQGASPAAYLLGLTGYAEYRSRQLISNFAHDTLDERAAATALKYGEYVDPSLYGMSGEPYYAADAREAIAQASFTGTAEQIAEQFAVLVKDSPGHWAYVGSSTYRYIGVGLTNRNGRWYCCIAMATDNSDES